MSVFYGFYCIYTTPCCTHPASSLLQSASKALPLALNERQEAVDWDTAWPAAREPPFKDDQVVQGEALFQSLRTARRVTDALMAKVGKLVRKGVVGAMHVLCVCVYTVLSVHIYCVCACILCVYTVLCACVLCVHVCPYTANRQRRGF